MYHLKHEEPFEHGYNVITEEGEPTEDTMMDFGILLLQTEEVYECHLNKERAFLLMNGKVTFNFRGSYFICDPKRIKSE